MDRVTFTCPSCRGSFPGPPSLAGSAAPCPKCGVNIDRWPGEPPLIPVGSGVESSTGLKPWRLTELWASAALVFGGVLILTAAMEWNSDHQIGSEEVLLFLGGCGLIGLSISLNAEADTARLSAKLAAMAPVAGKPLDVVRKKLGKPKVSETTEAGETLLTWESPGYRLTLAFRGGVCSRIAKEEVTAP